MVERDLAKVDVAGSTPVSPLQSAFQSSVSPSIDGLFPCGTLTY